MLRIAKPWCQVPCQHQQQGAEMLILMEEEEQQEDRVVSRWGHQIQ
jgi:hypothetical protein